MYIFVVCCDYCCVKAAHFKMRHTASAAPCPLCDDPAPTQLLPCFHFVCGGCLGDLVQDGCVCKVDASDGDARCLVPFTRHAIVNFRRRVRNIPTTPWTSTARPAM